jgi:glutamine amidotransferase|tara:strand:+ start:13108 stop:13740 length:633 start_codon:yes stop_codon:yes gene_type:complete
MSDSNILVLDIGAGNIHAINNILKKANISFNVGASLSDFKMASHIILPGVGGYEEFMSKLNDAHLLENLRNFHESFPDKFLLGICIGMQVLGNNSEEGGGDGLGLISGVVKKIEHEENIKIPHMGWNSIIPKKPANSILDNINFDLGFYFLHSYYFDLTNSLNCIAEFSYYKNYPALVNQGNVFGMQGHPEKSHDNGIQLIKNFCTLSNG